MRRERVYMSSISMQHRACLGIIGGVNGGYDGPLTPPRDFPLARLHPITASVQEVRSLSWPVCSPVSGREQRVGDHCEGLFFLVLLLRAKTTALHFQSQHMHDSHAHVPDGCRSLSNSLIFVSIVSVPL